MAPPAIRSIVPTALNSSRPHALLSSTRGRREAAGYSITSSAISRKSRGIVRPSAFAVFRLMTSSNLVGCSTGRSEGIAPLRTLPTIAPSCSHIAGRLGRKNITLQSAVAPKMDALVNQFCAAIRRALSLVSSFASMSALPPKADMD